jgi:hypothetical protein
VEQRFFETAPPDVPLQPAAPPSFDDLDSTLPERRRPRRGKASPRKRQFREPRDRWSPVRRAAARLVVLMAEVGRRLVATARDRWVRALETARDRWPGRAAARELAGRALRFVLGPVIDELPAERNRGTIVAAVAAIVVVVGLAAGVLTAYVPHLTFIR